MNLTSKSYVVIAVIGLLGIIGQWSETVSSDLWRYPAAAFIVALVLEARRTNRWKLKVTRQIDPTLHLGHKLSCPIDVKNQQRQSLIIQVQTVYPSTINGEQTLYQKEISEQCTLRLDFECMPQSLGKHSLCPVYSRILGPFRLAWWNRRFPIENTVTVIPDRLNRYDYMTSTGALGIHAIKSAGAGGELMGIREYLPGDPLRSVDWKATARSGGPKSRIFSEQQHLEIIILLDCGNTSTLQAGNLTRFSHYINIAARLAHKAILHGDAVGVVTFSDTVHASSPPVTGLNGLRGIRKILSESNLQARESNPLSATMHVRKQLRQRSLVVVFGDLDEANSASQLIRCAQILRPKHLPLFATLIDDDIELIKVQSAVNWIDPYNSLAAIELDIEKKRLIFKLHRLGCHVVCQRSSKLDHAILTHYDTLRSQV